LQLDQLRAAKRSPIGRAKKDHHGAAWAYDRLEIPGAAGLIAQAEVGDALTDLRTKFRDIDACPAVLTARRERRQKHKHQ
jgi:hypothetical protein